jgi:hypothetical protein
MSYDSVRQDEQMRVLDYSIDDFVLRYNAITALPAFLRVNPARQTLFMFPGGYRIDTEARHQPVEGRGSRLPGLRL